MNKSIRAGKSVFASVFSLLFLFFFVSANSSWSDGPWTQKITEPFLEEITLSLQGNPTEQQCRAANDRLFDAFTKQRFTDEYKGFAHFLYGAAQVCLTGYTDAAESKDFYFNIALENLAEAERRLPNYSPVYFLEGFILYLHNNDRPGAEQKILQALEYDPQFTEARELLNQIRVQSDQDSITTSGASSVQDDKPTEFTPIPFD